MEASPGITDISYSQLKENVPRVEQRARIVIKTGMLLARDLVGFARDLILPQYKDKNESRFDYLTRRTEQRHELTTRGVENYILEKELGTIVTRRAIMQRQDEQAQDLLS
jgi:hypothetical protein